MSIKITRKENVYNKIHQLCEKNLMIKNGLYGYEASLIAQETGYDRNNVSRELNTLFREKKIIKINGKPVRYLTKEAAESKLGIKYEELFYSCQEIFQDYIRGNHINHRKSINQVESHPEYPFSTLIGYNQSMKTQVKQAIAAIIYPPNGLHTLLIGPTGVGKTTFANVMYHYAVKSGRLKPNSPYIIFNCADYASNPQLLLSHLFGHIKGAFTGADKDKQGLVDQADNGILFLDEVHRLPPEGQEMLFSLIDRGEFRRLGESNAVHRSNLQLITATTEKPGEAVLQTFLRRIPCIIQLPSLEERSLKERLELICRLFHKEARNMNLPVTVSSEIIKLLLIYDCSGNLGQLSNDIQLICANAFVDFITNQKGKINIKLSQLNTKHINFFNIIEEKREELTQAFEWNRIKDFTFNPSENEHDVDDLIWKEQKNNDLYNQLMEMFQDNSDNPLSIEKINQLYDRHLIDYIEEKQATLDNQNYEQNAFFKVVSPEKYFIVREALEEASQKYDFYINQKVLHGLVLHIETLVDRIKSGQPLSSQNKEINKDEITDYYDTTILLVRKLEEKLDISIPEQEIIFIALFLRALNLKKQESKIGILVMTHGKEAANDFANVANTLLQVDHAHALTMPLDEKVNTVLTKAINLVKEIDEGKGVLLLVDMGSLATFGDIITEKTGIPTRTIKMVSTPMVIEATRKAMMPEVDLDTLVEFVLSMSDYVGRTISYNDSKSFKLDIPTETLHDKVLKLVSNVLTFIDFQKLAPLLESVLNNILEDLNIELDDSLYVKFMFHISCLLERSIRKESLEYKNLQQIKNMRMEVFEIIRINFAIVERTYGVIIPDSEIAYITEIFCYHNVPIHSMTY